MASPPEHKERSIAAFARGVDAASLPLANRLRNDIEAARRRFLDGQCDLAEYKMCLERFTRLVLDGEIPAEIDTQPPDGV